MKTNRISNGEAATTTTEVPSQPAIHQEPAPAQQVDTKSDSSVPQSTKQAAVPVEPRKSTTIEDLSDSWEKVVGKASTDSTLTTGSSISPREEQSLYATGSFDAMDEENINLQTDAATVAKMRSAATKKKKGKKTTSTAAEVAKKEMQSAPAAAKKKKKKVR